MTIEIIDVIKNPQYMNCKTMEDAIIEYMSRECLCPKEYYDDHTLTEILKEVFADFIKTCDNPGYYIGRIMDYISPNNILLQPKSLKDAIITTLLLVEVRKPRNKEHIYINGFDERIEKFEKMYATKEG